MPGSQNPLLHLESQESHSVRILLDHYHSCQGSTRQNASYFETTNHLLQPMSKFPKVKRDFALLLDNKITFEDLKTAAFQTEKSLLKDVNLFDVYTGSKLPEGKKSYALSFTIQDQRKTLTDKQVDKIMNKLQKRFENDFDASLR